MFAERHHIIKDFDSVHPMDIVNKLRTRCYAVFKGFDSGERTPPLIVDRGGVPMFKSDIIIAPQSLFWKGKYEDNRGKGLPHSQWRLRIHKEKGYPNFNKTS